MPRCTLLVNIWQVGEGVPARLQAEASGQEVDFAAIPASGDRFGPAVVARRWAP